VAKGVERHLAVLGLRVAPILEDAPERLRDVDRAAVAAAAVAEHEPVFARSSVKSSGNDAKRSGAELNERPRVWAPDSSPLTISLVEENAQCSTTDTPLSGLV
jgi:hypothetical protein